MKVVFAVLSLLALPVALSAESIFLNDLPPEDVQARLAAQSLNVQYAPFLGQRSLPPGEVPETVDGRIVENSDDYLQNAYMANQFHGQDGLGRSMFGYSDWNQGRLEARNVNGEVRGSYQYVDPFGENIVVNYWADSLGFHQTDNRQTVGAPQPVTETPEVQAARLAHQRAWEAAAQASQQNPDPMSDVYNANANRLDEQQSKFEQAQQLIAQQQIPNQYKRISATSAEVVGTAESRRNQQRVRIEDDDSRVAASENAIDRTSTEITGPPHGFFYNFDYPVQVVVPSPENIRRRVAQRIESDDSSVTPVPAQIRRPTIVAPPPSQPEIVSKTIAPVPVLSDRSDSVEVESAERKIVPLRIIESQKFKRSGEQPTSARRRQMAANRNRYQRQRPTDAVSTETASAATTTPSSAEVSVTRVIAAAPVRSHASAPSSDIIQIESLDEQQKHAAELRRLAGNTDTIAAVHDAQVHPKQAERIAIAMTAARKYRSHF